MRFLLKWYKLYRLYRLQKVKYTKKPPPNLSSRAWDFLCKKYFLPQFCFFNQHASLLLTQLKLLIAEFVKITENLWPQNLQDKQRTSTLVSNSQKNSNTFFVQYRTKWCYQKGARCYISYASNCPFKPAGLNKICRVERKLLSDVPHTDLPLRSRVD